MHGLRYDTETAGGVNVRVQSQLPAGSPQSITTLARAVDNFLRHDMSTYAAALAYRALFALFPFVIGVMGLINALDAPRFFEMLADWARTEPTNRLPGAIRQWIVFHARGQADGAALSVAAGAAVWAVATGARVLRRGLNVAAEETDIEPGWQRFAWSIIVAPIVGAAVIGAIVLFTFSQRALANAARWFSVNDFVLLLWNWLRFPAGVAIAIVVVAALYRFGPSRPRPFRMVISGAVAAAVVWIAASLVFSQAIGGVMKFGVTYGSFSAAIVLLVYLYLGAAGVLFGAELNAVMVDDHRRQAVSKK